MRLFYQKPIYLSIYPPAKEFRHRGAHNPGVRARLSELRRAPRKEARQNVVDPGCRSIVLAALVRRLLPWLMLRAALTTLSPNSWQCL